MEFKRVTINPRQMGGVPCLRGLRIPVATIVALVAGLIGEPNVAANAVCAAAASAIAIALDGVDGWLARRTGMVSAFGARFDMEVDALLIQVLAILAWQHGKAGAWILASGLLRYLFVAAGWVWTWMRSQRDPRWWAT